MVDLTCTVSPVGTRLCGRPAVGRVVAHGVINRDGTAACAYFCFQCAKEWRNFGIELLEKHA